MVVWWHPESATTVPASEREVALNDVRLGVR